MLRRFRVFLLIALPFFRLCAQQFGEITGTVTDASGAIVAGAHVTVTNSATQQVREASSNDSGVYAIPYLVPGTYAVRAEKPGFKVTTQSGVDVHVDNVARIDFQLQLGEISQQIEVTGGAPLLNTESVALGSVIQSAQIVNLPLNGRDYLNLVTLSSNAVGEMAVQCQEPALLHVELRSAPRSDHQPGPGWRGYRPDARRQLLANQPDDLRSPDASLQLRRGGHRHAVSGKYNPRSEEHTSELQSP